MHALQTVRTYRLAARTHPEPTTHIGHQAMDSIDLATPVVARDQKIVLHTRNACIHGPGRRAVRLRHRRSMRRRRRHRQKRDSHRMAHGVKDGGVPAPLWAGATDDSMAMDRWLRRAARVRRTSMDGHLARHNAFQPLIFEPKRTGCILAPPDKLMNWRHVRVPALHCTYITGRPCVCM
jgi:hypothetical protein